MNEADYTLSATDKAGNELMPRHEGVRVHPMFAVGGEYSLTHLHYLSGPAWEPDEIEHAVVRYVGPKRRAFGEKLKAGSR